VTGLQERSRSKETRTWETDDFSALPDIARIEKAQLLITTSETPFDHLLLLLLHLLRPLWRRVLSSRTLQHVAILVSMLAIFIPDSDILSPPIETFEIRLRL
jgi:hypothetical protein